MSNPNSYFTGSGDSLTNNLLNHVSTKPELGVQYKVEAYPDCYFVSRKGIFDSSYEGQRVELFQRDVVRPLRFGDDTPQDLLLSNELLDGRKLDKLQREMADKVESLIKRKH